MTATRDRLLDELLVVRCQEGSQTAFELLVRRWQRRLWRYARRQTGSSDAAWDVMQEAWIVILKGIRKLRDPAWFATWAYRIVRNKSADSWRRAARRRRLVEAAGERRRSDGDPPADARTDAVQAAIRRLPADRRELLALRYAEGLSTLEIAAVLGVPAGTVKSRLHHAREQVKRILEGEKP